MNSIVQNTMEELIVLNKGNSSSCWTMVRGEIWPKCWHLYFLVSIKAQIISSGQYYYETPPIATILFQYGPRSSLSWSSLSWSRAIWCLFLKTPHDSEIGSMSLFHQQGYLYFQAPSRSSVSLQGLLSFGLLPGKPGRVCFILWTP